ncbi:uncharacterized protein F4822DRAFT_434658 [Hypoxylon trugodes]|uniref:uncharacterized protein n=1 Tax=Hypoxylon trugodes TaxID=326681 RepID=UPI00218F9C88|nr:uncharacterized protein F4822DRAFT_434658 [Hypoxylon trugodes]KAI1383547.1 hypothetical protein F4822DRAFT_434658 [Hypoxylon trugodes]
MFPDPAVLPERYYRCDSSYSDWLLKSLSLAPKIHITMAHRFSLDDAPDKDAKKLVEESLVAIHGGSPTFKWIEDDGKSLVGNWAPLW